MILGLDELQSDNLRASEDWNAAYYQASFVWTVSTGYLKVSAFCIQQPITDLQSDVRDTQESGEACLLNEQPHYYVKLLCKNEVSIRGRESDARLKRELNFNYWKAIETHTIEWKLTILGRSPSKCQKFGSADDNLNLIHAFRNWNLSSQPDSQTDHPPPIKQSKRLKLRLNSNRECQSLQSPARLVRVIETDFGYQRERERTKINKNKIFISSHVAFRHVDVCKRWREIFEFEL